MEQKSGKDTKTNQETLQRIRSHKGITLLKLECTRLEARPEPTKSSVVVSTTLTHNFIIAYYCVCQVLGHMKLCQYQSFSCSKVSKDYKNIFKNENCFII